MLDLRACGSAPCISKNRRNKMPSLKDATTKPSNIGEVIPPATPFAQHVPPIIPREQPGLSPTSLGPAPALWTTDYDKVRQWVRPGTSQGRFPSLPTKANPQLNAAARSVAKAVVAATTAAPVTLPGEATTSFTTISLVAGANATGVVSLSHNFLLANIQVSSAARVRLYATAGARTADISRPPSVQITPGLANQLISAHNLTGLTGVPLNFPCSPSIPGFTTDGNVYWTITNTALTTQTITVTLTWLQLGSL
jgi:hypothetical protein